MNRMIGMLILCACWPVAALAADQAPSAVGDWVTADHEGVVEIAPCSSGLCGTLVGLRHDHPPGEIPKDKKNPDAGKQGTPLCGLLTLGSCVVIGQPLNFANIIALPLLFGIGVAFHIYFVMAWRSGGEHLLESSLTRAVFFSALATATGFGSLWLSSHPGTASMGKLLMISLVWTLVSALLFQPALMGPPPDQRALLGKA